MIELRIPLDWWSGEQEGVLTAWHVDDGQPVRAGDVVADIGVEKAQMEMEATSSGTLVHKVGEGEVLAAGQLIGVIEPD